jgi:hypothetical protein
MSEASEKVNPECSCSRYVEDGTRLKIALSRNAVNYNKEELGMEIERKYWVRKTTRDRYTPTLASPESTSLDPANYNNRPAGDLLEFYTRTSRMTALTRQFSEILCRGAPLAAKLLSFRGHTATSSMSALLGGRHSSLLGFRAPRGIPEADPQDLAARLPRSKAF